MMFKSKRKAFGQHFLINNTVINKISDQVFKFCEETGCKRILEIGPGKGAITFPLLERVEASEGFTLTAIEKDRELCTFWREKTLGREQFKMCEGDFLEVPLEEFFTEPMVIVSNLPYSASTEIMFRLLDQKSVDRMVLMFQKEVAERVEADLDRPSKKIGVPTLIAQNEFDIKKLIHVPPKSFKPPPKVESSVLIFERRETARIPRAAQDPELWRKTVNQAFRQRRKMIRSSFKSSPKLFAALEASDIDGTKRAESLNWSDWGRLFESLP